MYTMPLCCTGALYTFSHTASTNHKSRLCGGALPPCRPTREAARRRTVGVPSFRASYPPVFAQHSVRKPFRKCPPTDQYGKFWYDSQLAKTGHPHRTSATWCDRRCRNPPRRPIGEKRRPGRGWLPPRRRARARAVGAGRATRARRRSGLPAP